MSSNMETGHSKNVANARKVLSFAQAHGTNFKPSRAALKLAAYEEKINDTDNAIDMVRKAIPVFNGSVNQRVIAFDQMPPLATRAVNMLDSTEASPATVADAKAYLRKLQGRRAKEVEQAVETPEGETIPSAKTVSVSQQSFDGMVNNFANLVELLAATPEYQPNEEDLTVTALQTLVDNLLAHNDAVINTYTALSNSRVDRDRKLYDKLTGLVPISLDVKKYIRGVFGHRSAEAMQLDGIPFKNQKIKSKVG